MYVRFNRDYPYDVDKKTGVRRRIPANWTGNLDDTIAKAAIKSGAAEDLTPKTEEAAPAGDEPKTVLEVLEMANAEGVHFKTFEAEAKKLLGDATPSAKAEIVEALKAKLAQ